MKSYKILLVFVFLGSNVIVAQAQNIFKPKTVPPRFITDTALIEKNSLIDNCNNLSFNILKSNIKDNSNQLISGTSLYPLLSVLYAGSAGETRYEMRNGIGFYNDQAKNDASIKELLFNSKSDSLIELESGMGIWAVETANFKKSYYTKLKDVYGLTPFFFNPNDSSLRILTQLQINEWASNHTKGNITQLLNDKDITPLTQLIGVSALYFKGSWKKPFDEMFTSTDKFFPTAMTEVDIDFMTQSNEFNYFESELLQAVELNYANTDYSLSIIIPREGETIETIDKELDIKNIERIWKDMIPARVQLSIPKFTSNAQFPEITEQNNIKLDKFIQQCKFVVDEKGSEASATAAATMSTKSAYIANQILSFRADRPFVFVLREKQKNIILMIGKITNPQKD